MSRRRSVGALAIAAAAVIAPAAAWAGSFALLKTADQLVDARGMTLANGAPYGTNINFTSFTQDALTTFNGWQYTSYWVKDTSSGSAAYYLAVGRREVSGGGAWQVMNVPQTTFSAGMRSSTDRTPWNAHNVVSLGISPNDGAIHLFYDTHSSRMRYRVSTPGAATNPSAVAWNSSIFGAENATLGTGTTHNTTTYPAFLRTPEGGLQLFFRTGVSGNGAWRLHDYTPGTGGAAGTWNTGYQIDSASGTYSPLGSSLRNGYPNGFHYGPDGRLHYSFVYRENTGQGGNGTNHDLLYVYSDDRGRTWRNNAGVIVADRDSGTTAPGTFGVTSAGLVVVPLSQNSSLINQQAQRVDSAGRVHAAMWHLDSSQAPTATSWDIPNSAYYHYWRDDLGNWHRNTIDKTGDWIRPKLFFDANDNAIALIYSGTTVRIAMASRESNWSDWKVVHSESGYFSEPQADADLLASTGVLSLILQRNPTSSLAASEIRTLDFTTAHVPAVIKTFAAASGGEFGSAASWASGSVPGAADTAVVAGGRTARVSTAVTPIGNQLIIGSAGGTGRVDVEGGASLSVAGSILVGRDGGSAGTYVQTGGAVTAGYFMVGAFHSETSGGGLSSATVSGGTLTVDELRVAESANGSSSQSSFTQAGGSTTVNGELILADNGNTGTVAVTGGTLTVHGHLYRGNNKTNTARLFLAGGTLDMTGNTVTVSTFELNGGLLRNLGGYNGGAEIQKNTAGTISFGPNSFTNVVGIYSGSLRVASNSALGSTAGNTVIYGGTLAGALELPSTGGITLAESIVLAGRQGTANDAPHIVNAGGTNTLSGTIGTTSGGNQYNVSSDAGLLVITSAFNNNQTGGLTDSRFLKLQGDGHGRWQGRIADNGSGTPSRTALTKQGAGTWTLTGTNAYTGPTLVSAGTLRVDGSHTGGGIYTVSSGATLAGSGTIDPAAGAVISITGSLAPGGASAIGTLTIGSAASTNDVVFSSGELAIRVGRDGISDLLAIRGALDLSSGLNRLRLLPLAGGLDGSAYTLATFLPGTLGEGRFAEVYVGDTLVATSESSSEFAYVVVYDDAAGQIRMSTRLVPEPGSVALILPAMGGLMARRRRK